MLPILPEATHQDVFLLRATVLVNNLHHLPPPPTLLASSLERAQPEHLIFHWAESSRSTRSALLLLRLTHSHSRLEICWTRPAPLVISRVFSCCYLASCSPILSACLARSRLLPWYCSASESLSPPNSGAHTSPPPSVQLSQGRHISISVPRPGSSDFY